MIKLPNFQLHNLQTHCKILKKNHNSQFRGMKHFHRRILKAKVSFGRNFQNMQNMCDFCCARRNDNIVKKY